MFILKQGNIIAGTSEFEDELIKLKERIPNSVIEETNVNYVLYNGSYLAPEEVALKEQDKINHLTMTALDFVTYIKKAGVSDEIILQYLQANPSVQLQLTLCQNVYCGVVRQLCPIKITEELILTDEQVVNMFKDKNKIV